MWCGICDLLECGDEDGVSNFIGERQVGNILCYTALALLYSIIRRTCVAFLGIFRRVF